VCVCDVCVCVMCAMCAMCVMCVRGARAARACVWAGLACWWAPARARRGGRTRCAHMRARRRHLPRACEPSAWHTHPAALTPCRTHAPHYHTHTHARTHMRAVRGPGRGV
jgi:hypothetical protein